MSAASPDPGYNRSAGKYVPKSAAILFFSMALAAQQQKRNQPFTPADVAAGGKTFRSHCAPCHGYNGEGGRGPNLAAGRFFHGSSDEELVRNISEGIPGTEMPGIFYSEDRVRQLVAFIRSLQAGTERPSGDIASGSKLFRSKGCSGCHRVHGEGGALGPDLSGIGGERSVTNLSESITRPDVVVAPRYWTVSLEDSAGRPVKGFLLNEDTYTVQLIDNDEQLHSFDKATLKSYRIDKHSTMPAFETSLTLEELTDLVAYLWSLRPQEGYENR
jgi:putative heme-binding domain-containing protein